MERMRSLRLPQTPWTTLLALAVTAAGALILGLPRAQAADLETRNFSVSVDGKKAGEYKMVIQKQPDGSVVLYAASDVRVTVLAVPVYTYSYRGKEVWKDGRLQHFESKGKEKGKEFSVRADADSTAIRVVANGYGHSAVLDVWTTSCWQLPPAKFRNNAVVMLGCDTGADYPSRLQYVGTEKIAVAGQEMTCTHYRVNKDVPHELWYDAQERLVRDEWVSGGHRTVLEMMEVR
jgi:hypothetical protein